MRKLKFTPTKNRVSRHVFCEWNSLSFGSRNIGGIICGSCNFHRTLRRGEDKGGYELNNKIGKEDKCPNCSKVDWYWLPPIARVPRKLASKATWKKFWQNLKTRVFNHPKGGCR